MVMLMGVRAARHASGGLSGSPASDADAEGGCPAQRVMLMGVWLPPPPSRRCSPRWVITHSSPVALISACRREEGGSFLVYSCPPLP